MTPAEIIAWSEHQDTLGRRDAMGSRWTDWKVAIRNPDGSCKRDQNGHQIFETQAAFKERTTAVPFVPISPIGITMDLFS